MRRRIIALATAAVLVAMAVGVQEAGAVTAGFVRVATPNPPIPDGRLRATDCIGDWCMAVGYGNGASGGHVAIAGSLNGGKGTIRDAAAPANATDSVLAGVSCVSTKWCTAVGSLTSSTGEGAPLSEQWDGTAWAVVPIPSAAGATSSNLYSVSCVSQSFCIAVGVASYPTVPNQRGFVAAWNGTTWTEQPTPVPFPNGTWHFESVSCTSTTFCELIGNGYANGSRTVAERWDGQAWSLQTMAQPNNPHLMSVSCVSPSWCVASGMYDTLIEQWDGVAWTIPSVPPAMDQVRSVSCTSMTACMAVGRSALRWDGTQWTAVSTPYPPSETNGYLNGVSCAAANKCTAVGEYSPFVSGPNGSGFHSVAVHWNGTSFTLGQVTDRTGSHSARLQSTMCLSTTFCVAVGSYIAGNGYFEPLIERWNGTTITIDQPVSPPPFGGALTGVSCASTTSCFAVGGALVLRWDGRRWQTATDASPPNSDVHAVSCVSATWCMAVGQRQNQFGPNSAMEEVWDGTSWTLLPTVSLGSGFSVLKSVSCTATTECTAVGATDIAPYMARWNGSTWSVQPLPSLPGFYPQLEGVSCSTATTCAAVGYSGSGFGDDDALALAWNGSTWTLQPTPPGQSGRYERPVSVSCSLPTNCTAVGYTLFPSGTFALRWDGVTWSALSSETPPGTGATALYSVTCNAGPCLAVGVARDTTLAETSS